MTSMIGTAVLLAITALGGAGAQSTAQTIDTTLKAAAAGRIAVNNRVGRIVIESWDRAEVHVRATIPSGDRLNVGRNGGVLEIGRVVTAPGDNRPADLELQVPRRASLDVRAHGGTIEVRGADGSLRALSATGDVKVVGGEGTVTIDASSGTIDVRDAKGSVSAKTSAGAITIIRGATDITVESVAGNIAISDVPAKRVAATSLRGDVTVSGTIALGADYALNTHSGTMLLTLPREANVTVNAQSLQGQVESRFDGPLIRRDGVYEIVLGNGSATIHAMTFNGPIRVVPSTTAPRPE